MGILGGGHDGHPHPPSEAQVLPELPRAIPVDESTFEPLDAITDVMTGEVVDMMVTAAPNAGFYTGLVAVVVPVLIYLLRRFLTRNGK